MIKKIYKRKQTSTKLSKASPRFISKWSSFLLIFKKASTFHNSFQSFAWKYKKKKMKEMNEWYL